ncbi:MAG: hypothetical protein LC130_35025 [Bryobacterales bacterium]|nr:hypothetical protein [Bryobacterales bacterium]
MRLRADVKGTTGRTKHALGTIVEGRPTPTTELPVPRWVEISEEDGEFYLLYYDAQGVCFADTWHQTLEAAKHQGTFEFGITPEEWREV